MTPAEQLMKTVIEAWGEADLGPARAALDEDVIWKSAATQKGDGFCFGGLYQGRTNVIALLAKLSTQYSFEQATGKEFISRDEIVWGLFDVRGSYKLPGTSRGPRRPINLEMAFRWRIRDGKILEAQTFFDTATLLAQQAELHAAVSNSISAMPARKPAG